MAPTIQSPGVYINELTAFPNQVVPVATAVPAFIGYTPKAQYEGVSYYNKPVKITSWADFQAIFLLENPSPPADPVQQYSPQYYLVPQASQPTAGEYLLIGGTYYSVLPDPNTIYYLYNSVRMFYQNGGGDAYIVAVGGYGLPDKKPWINPALPVVNPNVKLAELQAGLALLKNELEPTLYICPEATLLSITDNGTLMQSMLLQANEMQTALCLFDVIGGAQPDPVLYVNDIATFRNNTGNTGLNYGASYYPFIGTTIMQPGDIDFTNFNGGDISQLEPLLNPPSSPNPAVVQILNSIKNSSSTHTQVQQALLVASETYQQIMHSVFGLANLQPPSGAMAGVYTLNDNSKGVWNAPANTSIVGSASLPIRLDDSQQAGLNVDAVSGKSINAIRFFNGQGILIWGARTLDGNSQDWRYIPVRRTITFLEQSMKQATSAYIFAPNTANTWASVISMLSSFLTNVWKQGGLMGATATDSFSVSVGLGTTMTADDILNGILRVSVKVAVTHPAEFIVITFEHQMASA